MARLVGNPAPHFEGEAVVNGQFQKVTLNDYSGKWKVLFFYPLDFTFVCPTEITAFSDNYSKFKDLNCEVFACSVDSKFSHLAWTKQARKDGGLGEISFPIIADLTKKISSDYEVLIEGAGISLRGLFIIDDKNTIQSAMINNNAVGRNVEEVLRLVEAFQYNAKHGEVCPANWSKGKDAMKPNAEGLKNWSTKHQK